MEITIKGNPKEIADLVLAVQSRQTEKVSPFKVLEEKFAAKSMEVIRST